MLTYENSVNFVNGEAPPVTLRNFFEPEDGFVWSTSRWSEITFSFTDHSKRPRASADIVLELDVFKAPPTLVGQSLLVYLNGLRVGSYFISGHTTCLVPFRPEILRPGENVLTFDTPDVSVPSDFGISDTRSLGIQLFSMQIRPAG